MQFLKSLLLLLILAGSITFSAKGDTRVLTPSALRANNLEYKQGRSNLFVCHLDLKTVTVIGVISKHVAAEFASCLSREPGIKSLVIDSPGGDVSAALAISAMIRKHSMVITVDGKCFSACATFLLPSARHVTVPSWSLVGIHNIAVLYTSNGKQSVAEVNIETTLASAKAWRELAEHKLVLAAVDQFYRVHKITPNLVSAFTAYRANRQTFWGSFAGRASNCPDYEMWILSKSQMTQIGVRVDGQVWLPESRREQSDVLASYGLDAVKHYFGDLAGLRSYCTPSGPLTRLLS